MTVTLCFVFVSRAIKDFLSGFGIGNLDLSDPEVVPPSLPSLTRHNISSYSSPFLSKMEAIPLQTMLFTIYLVWEIIPAVMVLVFFWCDLRRKVYI